MFTTIAEVAEANADIGQYFFSKGAMDSFRTTIHGELITGPGGQFFVTSEVFVSGEVGSGEEVRFSVRRVHRSGRVETEGEFFAYASEQDAMHAAKLAAGS